MIVKYAETEYVNVDTGEVIHGSKRFWRRHPFDTIKWLGKSKWQEDAKRGTNVIGVVVRERREFKVIARQTKIKF